METPERTQDVVFFVLLDGKSLQTFLNQRLKYHDSMRDEVPKVLQLSRDPAKLVLDAMEGFYPPHLKNGDIEFEGTVVMSTCILLLEELIGMSPLIRSHVKEEALKLAGEWKEKMIAVADHSLQVLGFLHLLAAYHLSSAFDSDEIMSYFEVVVDHSQTPEVCRLLGFADKIPELVQNLIDKNEHFLAIRFICAFGLREKYPLATLLSNHLKPIKKKARSILNTEKLYNLKSELLNSMDSGNEEVIDITLADLQDVIKCIETHKLEQYCTIQSIGELIGQLKLLKTEKLHSNVQNEKSSGKPRGLVDINSIDHPREFLPKTIFNKKFRAIKSISTLLAVILGSMDGPNLQYFLNKYPKGHKLLGVEVSIALQMSLDPAKLVLDAMQGFYPPRVMVGSKRVKENFIRRSCIFLLWELMKLSPPIKPFVKEEAAKLANDWRKKLNSKTKKALQVVGFLRLVAAFQLASEFDSNELLNFLENVAKHPFAPKPCEVLRFSQKIPGNPKLSSRNASPSAVRLCDPRCRGTCKDGNGRLRDVMCSVTLMYSSDPALLVLDLLQGSFSSSNKETNISKLDIFRSSFHLLQKLKEISPEIRPHVTEEAMHFAVEWKKRLPTSPWALDDWEVLAYICFLITYKLPTFIDGKEFLDLFLIAYKRKELPDLIRAVGLAHRMQDFIRRLVEMKRYIAAVRYTYEFQLVSVFSPVSLLQSYLVYSEGIAMEICEAADNSSEAQSAAIQEELSALKAVIKCIENHKLEDEYPPDNLKARVQDLERELNISFLPSKSSKRLEQDNGKPHRKRKHPATSSASQCKYHSQKKLHKGPRIGCHNPSSDPPQHPLRMQDHSNDRDQDTFMDPTAYSQLSGSCPKMPSSSSHPSTSTKALEQDMENPNDQNVPAPGPVPASQHNCPPQVYHEQTNASSSHTPRHPLLPQVHPAYHGQQIPHFVGPAIYNQSRGSASMMPHASCSPSTSTKAQEQDMENPRDQKSPAPSPALASIPAHNCISQLQAQVQPCIANHGHSNAYFFHNPQFPALRQVHPTYHGHHVPPVHLTTYNQLRGLAPMGPLASCSTSTSTKAPEQDMGNSNDRKSPVPAPGLAPQSVPRSQPNCSPQLQAHREACVAIGEHTSYSFQTPQRPLLPQAHPKYHGRRRNKVRPVDPSTCNQLRGLAPMMPRVSPFFWRYAPPGAPNPHGAIAFSPSQNGIVQSAVIQPPMSAPRPTHMSQSSGGQQSMNQDSANRQKDT